MANELTQYLRNRAISPFRSFFGAQDPFDRAFSNLVDLSFQDVAQDLAPVPNCDIEDEGNNYRIMMDLPGMTKDHIKVEANKDQLTIRAERREEKKTETKSKYLNEVYYGSFSRSFTLPSMVDQQKIDAKYENGVLTIVVPKSESHTSKLIPIH